VLGCTPICVTVTGPQIEVRDGSHVAERVRSAAWPAAVIHGAVLVRLLFAGAAAGCQHQT